MGPLTQFGVPLPAKATVRLRRDLQEFCVNQCCTVLHSWTEPVERVLAAAQCRNVGVLVPQETSIVATRDGVDSQRFEASTCDPSSS